MPSLVPLTFFWIAELKDGRIIPQFDPNTGKENSLKGINWKDVVGFGWYPFDEDLAAKISFQNDNILAIPTKNRFYHVRAKNGETIIAKRENIIKLFSYHVCGKCGFKWQFAKSSAELPSSDKAFVEYIRQGDRIVKFVSPICPNCGYHDSNDIPREKKLVRRVKEGRRQTVYVLGLKGKKLKKIYEDGRVEEC